MYDGTSEVIAEATSESYALVEDDQHRQVRATVSFVDDDGYREEFSIILSDAVSPEDNVPATGPLTLGGTTQVGENADGRGSTTSWTTTA